ncbi:MAG: MATE family efflux transporter [Thermoleophilia bacterium]
MGGGSIATRMDFRRDREVLSLAVPALGALAADPLLSLVDTALVGHLGSAQLAALGLSVVAFNLAFVVFNFLAYGTTGPVARMLAQDRPADAVRHVVQAVWVAIVLGVAMTAVALLFGRPLGALLGAKDEVMDHFLAYFLIRMLALTPMLLVLVGHGLFRGLLDTRTPLLITVAVNLINGVLSYVLIYPVGLGVRGAAIGTVAAQSVACGLFVWLGYRRLLPLAAGVGWRPQRESMRHLLALSRDLLIRTFSIHGVFVLSAAVAARMGTAVLAGHQVAVELWMFLVLVLDSIAIAGQALTGRYLGMGDRAGARAVGARMIRWGVGFGAVLAVGFWLLSGLLPRIFTSDPAVIAAASSVFPFVVAFQPVNGYVFVLDGILIGASDARYLAGAMLASAAAAAPLTALSLRMDWGIRGIWAALGVFMIVRAVLVGVRFAQGRWMG